MDGTGRGPRAGWHLQRPGERRERCLRARPENFEQFSADPEAWIDAAHYLAVVGHFRGSAKSGAAVNVPFVHLWTMREGKAASFENVVDRDLWTQAWGG